MDKLQKTYSQKKKPDTKGLQLYDLIHMYVWKGKSIETENRLVVADPARVGVKR